MLEFTYNIYTKLLGGKAPATSNRTLAVGMKNKEEPRSEPLILSENISTAARRNANAKNTTALLIREVPNDGTHVDEKLASKAKVSFSKYGFFRSSVSLSMLY